MKFADYQLVQTLRKHWYYYIRIHCGKLTYDIDMETLFEFQAKKLSGEIQKLSQYRGKIVLVVNTASLWGATIRDFTGINKLAEKFPDELVILAFPSNQFGHQENGDGEEIINTLKYVRPGKGFVPKAVMFHKIDVNGSNEHELFTWLKQKLPIPQDEGLKLMGDQKYIIWTPIQRSDISWNFEKFLIDPQGIPVKRFSRTFPAIDIEPDIASLMKKHNLHSKDISLASK